MAAMVEYLRAALPPRYVTMEEILERVDKGEAVERLRQSLPDTVVLLGEQVCKSCALFAMGFAKAMGVTDEQTFKKAIVEGYCVPHSHAVLPAEAFSRAVDEGFEAFERVSEARRGRNDPAPVLVELMALEDRWPSIALMAQVEGQEFAQAWRVGKPLRADGSSFAVAVLRGWTLEPERALALLPTTLQSRDAGG